MTKILILLNQQVLISQIEETPSELGEPDCKLISPFLVKNNSSGDFFLEPWISNYTSQNTFMIHSDKILTIVDPKSQILEKYQSFIK